MRALSIRQPYAELRIAGDQDGGPLGLSWRFRPVGTKIVGERFHLYAAKAKAKRLVWSDDLAIATPLSGTRSRSFVRHCVMMVRYRIRQSIPT